MTRLRGLFAVSVLVAVVCAATSSCGQDLAASSDDVLRRAGVDPVPASAAHFDLPDTIAAPVFSSSDGGAVGSRPVAAGLRIPSAGLQTIADGFQANYMVPASQVRVIELSATSVTSIFDIAVPSTTQGMFVVAFAVGDFTARLAKVPPGGEPITGRTAYALVAADGSMLGGGLTKADLSQVLYDAAPEAVTLDSLIGSGS